MSADSARARSGRVHAWILPGPFRPERQVVKDQETVQKFVERRAQGWSYVRIAAELGVAKSTLIDWSRKCRFDINNRRALELDDLQSRVLGTVQSRVADLAGKLSRVEEELRKRDLTQVPTTRLYAMADALRRQIERETQAVRFVTPVKDIPNDEYVEQVQEWNP
jgi:hypothetical protein